MTFNDAVKTGFRKYFVFGGRASRSEYWFWILFTFLLALGGVVLDVAFGWGSKPEEGSGPLATFASVATFIPSFAVSVRRLHDTNRSAWWLSGVFIGWFVFALLMIGVFEAVGNDSDTGWIVAAIVGLPLVGFSIALMVFPFLAGTPGANRYGAPELPQFNSARNVGAAPSDETALVSSNVNRWVLSGFDSVGNIVRFEFDVANRSSRSFIIGRNSDVCDLVIDDLSVSRKHAEIVVNPSGVYIRDLGSSNGTRMNGQKLSNDSLRLPVNGTLSLGSVELSIFGS